MAETYEHLERRCNDYGCEIEYLKERIKKLVMENQELLAKCGHQSISINELNEKVRKLDALEEAGVDNWEGYDYAMQILKGE